jgi:hypothetical protein
MDGQGPFPQTFHPGLRLEDKWVQYQLVKSIVPMPETVIFNPQDMKEAEAFLKRKGKLVLKRRLGRGGRGFKVIPDRAALSAPETGGFPSLLQEYVESKTEGYTFSIRATAFAGEFICLYANLSTRSHSNHGALTFVSTGNDFGLADRKFETEFFNQKSWEAELWFGKDAPPYLKHNLYEDEVARTILFLPVSLYQWITEASVKIERHYEGFDFSTLPEACFERR